MFILQAGHPLTAPAYSEHRSTLARQLGLGRKPKAAVAATLTPATETPVENGEEKAEADDPRPDLTPAFGSKSDVVDEAASQPTKTRQRRPRSRAASPQTEPLSPPTTDA
jgi:hypothetical protein